MMDRNWLQHYPAGVPQTIDPEQYRSVPHLLEESFRKFADKPFSVCMDVWMSYGELDTLSAALGAWLQSRGLEPGARVAIMLPNIPQFAVTMAAVLRAGYTCVNVNPLYTARELEHQLKDSGSTAIIILENFAHTLQAVIDKTPIKQVVMTSMGDLLGGLKGAWITFAVRHLAKMVPPYQIPLTPGRSVVPFSQALAEGRGLKLQPADSNLDSIAFLQYTGGTTGLSKGATLTHRNVIANMLQNDAWAGPTLRDAAAGGGLVTMCALPLYHILALNACMLMGARWGAMNVLIPNPRDMPGFVRELAKYRVNFFPGVNTLFNGLLNQPDLGKVDFSGLRITLGGGMAVQEVVSDRWRKVTGSPLREGYGLSETSPTATLCPPGLDTFSGTIGLPVPSTEVAILDDDGQPVPLGQAGEIAIRGPQVMRGYWNRPDETAKVMTPQGYFKSGDVGVMDERGYVKIVDRKKDMILVSGFNVYPNEIESVVAGHPGVLECACIGVPDEHSGEAVKVFVVRKDPNLTVADLMVYSKEQFTGYKRPKYIEFREELPKTNVGKILRRALRDEPKVAVAA